MMSSAILDGIETLLLDCDGVIWHGSRMISDQITPALNALRSKHGLRLVFITNNSSKSRREYAEKLASLEVAGVSEEDIVCTGWLLTQHIAMNGHGSVYVVGTEMLASAIQSDLPHVTVIDGNKDNVGDFDFGKEEFSGSVDAVIVGKHALLSSLGFDPQINYRKIARAAHYIRNGADFVATSRVGEYIADRGQLLPGTGAMVSAIEASSGGNKKPCIIGKPFISETVLLRMGINPSTAMMIGDRLDTDIAFGQRLGMRTLLVESGIDTRATVSAFKADFVLPSIVDLAGCC